MPARLSRPARLLADLIAIPSIGLDDTASGVRVGEADVAKHVAAHLRRLGGEVSLQTIQPGRPNVIAHFRSGNRRAPTIALVPHLDTVGVAGMTIEPFVPHVRANRMYGRGACDTKGPMAAALAGLERWLAGRRGAQPLNVVFVATMGEEALSIGARALCAGGFRADFAFVLEPTDLKLVTAGKGVLRLRVHAKGRAAHAAAPEKGCNAVHRAMPLLAACAGELPAQFRREGHPTLGAATINLGFVRGGDAFNIVPDRCEVGLDIRTHPDFEADAALRRVRAYTRGLRVAVETAGPAFALDAHNPWLAALRPLGLARVAVPWFSDANILNAHGTAAVALGPGSIGQAHTRDEFIALPALDEGAALFARCLDEFAANPPPRTAQPARNLHAK